VSNGLDGRHRDANGQISEKHGNTKVETLREIYGDNFLSQWRSDATLETVRAETGQSLSQMVHNPPTRNK
jgi:hypothetical protein